MVSVIGDARDSIRDRMEVIAFHLSNHVERIQIQSASLASSAHQRLHNFYEDLLQWLESQNLSGKFTEVYDKIHGQGQAFFAFFRSFDQFCQFSNYYNHAKDFLFRNEISKQAIFFGFAGLVTGSVIGLCIGYSFKSGSSSFSSPTSDGSSGSLALNGSRGSIRSMKAIICFSPRNGIDGITLSSIPIPSITQPNQVLIQVRSTGIDNIDAKVANGYGYLFRQYFGIKSAHRSTTPFILGRECSGIVIDVGSKVTNFDINDRVWVCLPLWSTLGVMSEYIVVPEQYVGHKPKNISFEGGAVLPYASVTVWHKIIGRNHLTPATIKSRRVLIHLGSSSKNDGVGLTVTQILKSWGGRITISTQEEAPPCPSVGDSGSETRTRTNDEDDDDDEEDSDNDNQTVVSSRTHSISSSAQMTFLHTLKSLGAESHLIIPKDESLLPDLTQRIFDVVINTDSPTLTSLLQKFAKDPSGAVIETFPIHLQPPVSSMWRRMIPNSIASYLCRKESLDEPQDTSSLLSECKKLVEFGQIVPVVAKSFLPAQYDQAFRHVSNLSRSALSQAHVGKSVIVFKIN